MVIVLEWFLYFVIYSLIGYLFEVIYCSLRNKKLTNRGFLRSPFCPLYGFGAVFVLLLVNPFIDNVILVLILGIVITSTVEYIAGYIMDKVFNMKWWDYSSYKFNIHGRVCLLNSLMFGALVVLLVYFVHPFVAGLISSLSFPVLLALFLVMGVILLTDTIISTKETLLLKKYTKIYIVDKTSSEIREDKKVNRFERMLVYFFAKYPRLEFRFKGLEGKYSIKKVKEYFKKKFKINN
ncbi:TPA: putative ABC transporter permease [bacterium]|nr:putative ABC transporter permease [bacterium]